MIIQLNINMIKKKKTYEQIKDYLNAKKQKRRQETQKKTKRHPKKKVLNQEYENTKDSPLVF